METNVSQSLPPRFWAKVQKTETCWEWTGSKTKGYGQVKFNRRVHQAHRLAYAEVNGPVPSGMDVDHKCHNRSCVRPDHLRLTSHKQNMEHQKGAQANTTSGVRGVSWYKASGKWAAHVKHNGRKIHVGYFVHLADAEAAVVAKRLELFTHNDVDRSGSCVRGVKG